EDEGLAGIPANDDPRVQRDAAEEGQPELLRGSFPAAAFEHVDGLPAVRAHQSAHVLDDAHDGEADRLSETDALPDVEQGHLLRGRHDDGAIRVGDLLGDAEGLVARSWREVDDHEIELAPVHVDQHLLDRFDLQGPPPDHWRVPADEELGHRDYL